MNTPLLHPPHAKPDLPDPVPRFRDLVSVSLCWQHCLERARGLARAREPLLVTGERGSGKWTLIQAIHAEGRFPHYPHLRLVACDPAAAGRFEATLREVGLGTLCVCEVALATDSLLAAMRHALESGFLQERGVRLVWTTTRSLDELAANPRMAAAGVLPLLGVDTHRVPSLRECPVDVLPRFEAALRAAARRQRRRIAQLSSAARVALEAYAWPGNIGELLEVARRVAAGARKGIVRLEDLQLEAAAQAPLPAPPRPRAVAVTDAKLEVLLTALARAEGHTGKVARELGIARSTVYEWIERYQLDLRMFRMRAARA